MRYNFSVEGSKNPKDQRRAVLDLRRMIRLGRIAEAALLDIEQQGSTNKMVPLARSKTTYYKEGYRREGFHVACIKLPAIVPVQIDFESDLRDMSFGVGRLFRAKYAGGLCHQFAISISAPVYIEGRDNPSQFTRKGPETIRIGTIRVNKHHLSWIPPIDRGVIKIRPQHTPRESLEAIARIIAQFVIIPEGYVKKTQLIDDAREQLIRKLIDSGFLEDQIRDLHAKAKILKVMEA